MKLHSKYMALMAGAALLLVNIYSAKALTPPAPQPKETTTINKETKKKVIPPITSPEQQLKIKENDVMDELPG